MSLSILIITGQSGSGKSTVLKELEDLGYYCIDNMPSSLMEGLVRLADKKLRADRLALVMDIRERSFVNEAPPLLAGLRAEVDSLRLVYLDAREETLVRRYSETRRAHPLDSGEGLRSSIALERQILAPLRELANEAIDTSALSPHQLRALVRLRLADNGDDDSVKLAVLSFAFRHGVPIEADMVLDARCVSNPYFVPELRDQTGFDPAVSDYVMGETTAQTLVERTAELLTLLVPDYQKQGKRYLTVAIGCTGGQHRSVAVVNALAARLRAQGLAVDARHRDVPGGEP